MKVRAGDNSRPDNSRRMVLLIYIPFSTHSPRIPRRQKIKPPPSILQRPGNHRAFSPRRSYALATKKRRGTELNNKTETHKKMEGGTKYQAKKRKRKREMGGRVVWKKRKGRKIREKIHAYAISRFARIGRQRVALAVVFEVAEPVPTRRWPAICIRGARGWWTRRLEAAEEGRL